MTPLTFDLPDSLGAKIETERKRLKVLTASEVVREALLQFDFGAYAPKRDLHGQISVRLPSELRARLRRAAKTKRVSVGELIRAAIEAQIARGVNHSTQRA